MQFADLPPIPPPTHVSDLLIPPLNFAMVRPGVYRSGYPDKKNFPFLKKLKLHTILNLSSVEYSAEAVAFFQKNNITAIQLPFGDNKEPFLGIPEERMRHALIIALMSTQNKPILVHCAKGTHRTGCLIGCLRKSEKWSLTGILDEYRRFAGTKVRLLDQQYIEFFDIRDVVKIAREKMLEDDRSTPRKSS